MIITVTNQKGGVAKTTTAAALLSYYQEQGKKALAIDLDPQCNFSLITGAEMSGRSILGVLTGQANTADTIQHTPNGDIIAGSEALSAADSLLNNTGKEYRLREALEQIAGQYERIVIDSPPALGVLSVNALTAADTVIIPCAADLLSIQSLKQLENTISVVKKYCNPNLSIAGILLTRHNGRTLLSRDFQSILEQEAAAMGTKVFETAIRESVAIRQAQAMQKSIFTQQGGAVDDYKAFIEEFEKGERNHEQKA